MAEAAAALAKHAPQGLTEGEYAKFCEFFYRRTGIMFNESKKYFVERRIFERMAGTGSETFRDYFTLVRFQASGEEFQALVNTMTVNETYFMREQYQLDALAGSILPDVVRGKPRGATVRVWSIPCSTGEEPYSIAIHLLENWAQVDDYAVEIKASDIDSRVLDDARAGIYGQRSLQRVGPELRSRYFSKIGPDQFQIREEIRDSIDLSLINVIEAAQMRRFHDIHVIFCRNLLIYFDDISRRRVVEGFYECLAPGGYVCLGHSESMSRISSLFKAKKFMDSIVYQKPLGAE